jgi:hypothetical protein
MIIWCGDKTHLVHYPLRRGELFNLVAVFHSNRYEEGWDTYGDPTELYERFGLHQRRRVSPMQNRTRESSISALYPTTRDVNSVK